MSQWTVPLLHPEPGVEYILQGALLHHCLPKQGAARGDADLRFMHSHRIWWKRGLLFEEKFDKSAAVIPAFKSGSKYLTRFEDRHSGVE